MEATMKTIEQIEKSLIAKVQAQPANPQFVTLPYYGNINDQRTYQRCPSIDDAERICTLQSHVIIETKNGDARQVKVNGAVRRWKRNRQRIEIPMKYGLYEYFTFGAEDVGSILIPV